MSHDKPPNGPSTSHAVRDMQHIGIADIAQEMKTLQARLTHLTSIVEDQSRQLDERFPARPSPLLAAPIASHPSAHHPPSGPATRAAIGVASGLPAGTYSSVSLPTAGAASASRGDASRGDASMFSSPARVPSGQRQTRPPLPASDKEEDGQSGDEEDTLLANVPQHLRDLARRVPSCVPPWGDNTKMKAEFLPELQSLEQLYHWLDIMARVLCNPEIDAESALRLAGEAILAMENIIIQRRCALWVRSTMCEPVADLHEALLAHPNLSPGQLATVTTAIQLAQGQALIDLGNNSEHGRTSSGAGFSGSSSSWRGDDRHDRARGRGSRGRFYHARQAAEPRSPSSRSSSRSHSDSEDSREGRGLSPQQQVGADRGHGADAADQ